MEEYTNNLVTCKGLNKRYGKCIALSDVDLTLQTGKTIGLLGPNGSGKTTFIKILAGLLTKDSGVVSVLGNNIGVETKALVSYLPERPYYDRTDRVAEYLDIFADFYADFDYNKATSMLVRLGVDPNKRFKELSKGNCEKVQLTLAMSRKAKLYLLDEPIGGVDPAARDLILDTILSNQSSDSSILISTHLIQDIESVLDDVVFIKQGKIVLHDSADNIREQNNKSIDELFREVFKCL